MNLKPFAPYALISFAVCGGVALVAALSQSALLAMQQSASFPRISGEKAQKDARIILDSKCAACHGESPNYSSFVNFFSGGLLQKHVESAQKAYLIPGKPAHRPALIDALKMDRVLSTRRMPPSAYSVVHFGSRLTPRDVAVLRNAFSHDVSLRHFAPIEPAEKPQGLEAAKVRLGHLLFFDTRLSTNNSISCATCHDLTKGGTDNKPKSEGVPGPDGKPQLGGVNAPTVYNAAGNIRQFWDGRAADLKEQAGGPPLNPVEMGYQSPEDWDSIIAKLQQDPELVRLFALVYSKEGMTGDTVTDAIAAYERTLVTPGSAFDRYLDGDTEALTSQQKDGLQAFVQYGCVTCHAGATLGGMSFEHINTHAPFRAHAPSYQEGAYGLKDFTGREEDRDLFRVPNLRNIALTAPYFHTGTVDLLEDAVRIMFETESGTQPTQAEREAVTAFLRAQTGCLHGKPLDQLTPEDVQPRQESTAP